MTAPFPTKVLGIFEKTLSKPQREGKLKKPGPPVVPPWRAAMDTEAERRLPPCRGWRRPTRPVLPLKERLVPPPDIAEIERILGTEAAARLPGFHEPEHMTMCL